MILREFKVWGGKREENDSLYIWAKDVDDAIGIARLTDQSICISQWTGNEKSYEEALEQEPCDDVVSRAEVFEIMGNLMSIPYDFDRPINDDDVSESMDKIKALPSVTPTRKKGKWIRTYKIGFGEFAEYEVELIDGFVADNCHCSECGEELEKGERGIYCPNCGAKMVEPQESEG